ncbi:MULTISPECIES: tyrosine-type recombinase/integrase [Bacillaceae]|uniref:Tyrosine-type recombinase/integrase n=1 Tax=Evansella alkalicola TaxID=745819 RepID=A0ABS6JTG2_9BACI|nr:MULTISPECIES: tyrosine-type recombinase/integrase [Bacillaceae]MBU9720537.1 tyrosine-type recombinase/integrase [Bacillus alkalicola]
MLLKFAIEDFLDDREFKNVTKPTLDTYKVIFKQFSHYVSEQGVVNVEDITPNLMKKYFVYCSKELGNNVVSVNAKIRRLRAFMNYMVEEEVISKSPMEKIQQSKEDIRINVFTNYHIKQMLKYYRKIQQREKEFWAYRDHTIILFLLGTGVRLNEMCNTKWSDIDFKEHHLIVFGKARMTQTIPLAEKLVKELSAYKLYCETYFGEVNEYVFTNIRNKRMTDEAVKNVFKRLKTIMNFRDVRLSAHTFRHTFAHRCLMSGMDVFTLQKLMRHNSLNTTQKYLALWGHDLRKQSEKYNPLNTMDIF